MECYSVLDCSVDIETFNSRGASSGKRVNHKRACIQLGRDQFNDLVFRLNNTSYTMKDYKVKFFWVFIFTIFLKSIFLYGSTKSAKIPSFNPTWAGLF